MSGIHEFLFDPTTGLLDKEVFGVLFPMGVSGIAALIPSVRRAVRDAWKRAWRSDSSPLVSKRAWPAAEQPVDLVRSQSRVLIIDDAKFAGYGHLADRGYRVQQWRSVERDRARTIDRDFDLLLLDIRKVRDGFGARDGVEALTMIRRDNPWVPILMITASPEALDTSRVEIVKRWTEGVLDKSLAFHELEDALIGSLKRARTTAYYEHTLSRLGVSEPAALLVELTTKKASELVWQLRHDAPSTPLMADQVRSVLAIAESILEGTRWLNTPQ